MPNPTLCIGYERGGKFNQTRLKDVYDFDMLHAKGRLYHTGDSHVRTLNHV